MTFPGRLNAPPAYIPLQVSNLSSWPREENTRSYPYGVNNACTIPSFSDLNLLHKSSMVALRDNGSSDNPATLHRLKSMTWSMELRNSIPGNRLSVITLKLQDYAKSHLGEVEVKFQLSRDTLEAMLRSLTYINDQLSDSGRLQSEPNTKRPRQ
ncbi:Protein FAR1-RELATED SEQUENCE 3 [Dendrobium catenatum]|uniref:Protein FAR1-RELATED SEQUENCE 3 n=1 Tax=Dendrobium catenatum TaxID=906689 RepID=A0A2I0VW29_9ASPA|nr:Protein FAR1-RELATED SEQUENCE 3 [Dendrobium catenatum]